MKECKECKERKTKDNFYQNGIGGHRPRCKSCESNKIRKNYKNKKCGFCEKEFRPSSSVNKFCSKKCSVKHSVNKRSNKPKVKNCNFCEKEFIPYTSLDKFCSANCRVDNQKSKRSKNWSKESCKKIEGKNNPAFKHGLRVKDKKIDGTGMREYRRNRESYIDNMKDEYDYLFCEKCGITNTKFETHHIVFRSEKPKHEHLHSHKNLIHVCVQCHNDFHKKKGIRNELVVERGLSVLFGNDILDK